MFDTPGNCLTVVKSALFNSFARKLHHHFNPFLPPTLLIPLPIALLLNSVAKSLFFFKPSWSCDFSLKGFFCTFHSGMSTCIFLQNMTRDKWLFSSQGIMAPYIPSAEVGMKLALIGTWVIYHLYFMKRRS